MTLNKMMIIGNLGADPELRYTPGGKAVAELRVAVNDRSKGADGEWVEETQGFRVELWEQAAGRGGGRGGGAPVVPRRVVGAGRRAGCRAAAQGAQGLRRGCASCTRMGGEGRTEAH